MPCPGMPATSGSHINESLFWVTFDLRSSREKGVVPPKRAKAVFHLNIKVLQHQLVTATKGKGIKKDALVEATRENNWRWKAK